MIVEKRTTARKLIFYTFLTCFCFITIFPFYWMIVGSLQTTKTMFDYNGILPKSIDFTGYVRMFKERPLVQWIRNTFFVSSISVVIGTSISVLAGLSLSRYQYRLRMFFLFLILLTNLLPEPTILIPLYITMRNIGLADTLIGVAIIDVGFSLPLAVWMIKNFFDYIPKSIEDAARIDGCTNLGMLIKIYLPLSLPGLATIIIFIFWVAWGEYIFAYTFISTESKWVFSIALPSFIKEHDILWNQMMAATLIFTVPVIVLFIFIQRHFVTGLTAGAVKG